MGLPVPVAKIRCGGIAPLRLDGGPFDKEGAINIILATYSTLTEKYAEAHLKRGGTPSAVYDAKIEKN